MSALQRVVDSVVERATRSGIGSAAAAGVVHAGQRVVSFAGYPAEDDPTPVSAGSRFDVASITKTYLAAALLRLIDQGVLDPDAPISQFAEVGFGDDARKISLRMLLTHTAGLPHDVFLWRDVTVPREERLGRVLRTPLQSPPGSKFRYSCAGFIIAGVIAEQATGRSLSELVCEHVTGPLSVESTVFGPVDAGVAIATEDQSAIGRGVVRGEVHDELAWWLGGQVGNAGIFASADDVLSFAASFCDSRLLGEAGWALATVPAAQPQPPDFGHSLGMRIRDASFMGPAAAIGHTGFTGTMWWTDPSRDLAVVLLTNRVHPTREGVDIGPLRREFSREVLSEIDALSS